MTPGAGAAVAALTMLLAGCAPDTPLDASQLPAVRPGQWSFEGTAGAEATHGRVCLKGIDDALGLSHPGCRGFHYSRELGGALVARDRCVNPDGTTVQTRERLAGDYVTHMTFEDDILITRRTARPLHTQVRVDYRYQGPCPADGEGGASPLPGG